jgi:predicted Zn-dependent protease
LLQIKLKYLLYFLLLNIISVQVGFSQNFKNEEERRKYAEKLFADKKYIEASSHFLHFLSLEPNDYELNFKYGTCVIYTESDKTKALKYLQYSVKSPTIDPLALLLFSQSISNKF